MQQNLFETLLIIAYSCLALISVVIAVYAIGASYVGRETHRSKWRKRVRREILERRVRELALRVGIEGINKEKQLCDKEIAEIDDRLSSLGIWEAVVIPTVMFSIALILTISFTCFSEDENFWYEWFAILFILAGAYFLARTLFAIEWSTSRIPLPEFLVTFEDGQTSQKHKTKENVALNISIQNIGEDVAEGVEVFIGFPPNFKIQKQTVYPVVKQTARTKHPDYSAMVVEIKRIYMEIEVPLLSIIVEMPEEAGNYEILVEIYEQKRVGASSHKLNLEIHN